MQKLDKNAGSRTLTWVMGSLFAVVLAGCGGEGGGGSYAPPGTLGVSLTDAPACGYDAVNVTVLKVRAHQSSSAADTDAGWTDITLNPARKINLLNLSNGVLDNLGETPLNAGHYTQLRLVLDANTGAGLANSVVPAGGVETSLVTPSAVQSGIKLVNEFDVASGQRVDLVLDFDACKSVVKRGNGSYALKPVVKVVPFALNGMGGFVDLALLGSGVMVSAQQNGAVVQSTAPNAVTGEFFLGRLATGNYDVVLTATDRAAAVITGVPVSSPTSVAVLSSSATPLSLPVSLSRSISGTAVLNPSSATEVAYVAAKQSVSSTSTVTLQTVAADDSSVPPGAYALSVPIGPPLLGQYSATMPITLAAQAAVAGKYSAEASASGYQSQTVSNLDLTAGNVTRNFTLVP